MTRLDYQIVQVNAPTVKYIKTKYGIAMWVRGFTYREWICAVTGERIPKGYYAWRISMPQTGEEMRLRVIGKVFDDPADKLPIQHVDTPNSVAARWR